jgi:hypothetical protein
MTSIREDEALKGQNDVRVQYERSEGTRRESEGAWSHVSRTRIGIHHSHVWPLAYTRSGLEMILFMLKSTICGQYRMMNGVLRSSFHFMDGS